MVGTQGGVIFIRNPQRSYVTKQNHHTCSLYLFFRFASHEVSILSRLNQLSKQVTANKSSTTKTPNINLYTTQTPNGIKISMTLEQLG